MWAAPVLATYAAIIVALTMWFLHEKAVKDTEKRLANRFTEELRAESDRARLIGIEVGYRRKESGRAMYYPDEKPS